MKMQHNFKNKGFSYFRQSTVTFLYSVIILEQVKRCTNKKTTPIFMHHYKPYVIALKILYKKCYGH